MTLVGRMLGCLLLMLAFGLAGCNRAYPPPNPGDYDPGLPPVTFTREQNATSARINAIAVQPDGKFLVGGSFVAVDTLRNGVVRFELGGSVESTATFQVGTGPTTGVNGGEVVCVAVQTDGKIVIGGSFQNVAGQAHSNLARLNSDGSVDASFNPFISHAVVGLALQPDGKILIVGYFDGVNQVVRHGIARLQADGSLDASFDPGDPVHTYGCLALQADGKILAGENDLVPDGAATPSRRLSRFDASGARDPSFDVSVRGQVYCLSLQSDGGILIGGRYFQVLTNFGASPFLQGFARVRADGSFDFSVYLGPFPFGNEFVNSIAVQANGKVLIGGRFEFASGILGTVNENVIFRGPADSVDISSLALTQEGKILTGTNQGDASFPPLSRRYNEPASETITIGAAQAHWIRTGAAPEVAQVTFELSVDNGTSWTLLGPGVRVADGWVVNGLSLPASGRVRARGRTSSGAGNGSSGLVESIAFFNPPDTFITVGPAGTVRSNNATFEFSASEPALRFTYALDGGALVDTTATTVTFPGLSHGAHTFSVFATDLLGNADPTPASRAWTVDMNALVAGSADLGFVHDAPDSPSVNGPVDVIAVQPDGKFLIAGRFSNVAGQPRFGLARILPGGHLDDPFAADAVPSGGPLQALAVQADGKTLVGGAFTFWNGEPRSRLARLNPDGTLEGTETFHPGNINSSVTNLAVQADGKILIAGDFSMVEGQPRTQIARLLADGTLDPTFDASVPDGVILCLALQANGEILIGGGYFSRNNQPAPPVFRLFSDGSLDSSFTSTLNPFGSAQTLAVEANGEILVAGYFPPGGSHPERSLVRLFYDGTTDAAFNPGTGASAILDVVVQADRAILVGGRFTTFDGQPRGGIARLNPDGSLQDTNAFDPNGGAFDGSPSQPGTVNVLAIQADGKILVGGQFRSVAGRDVSNIARLNNDPAPTTLTVVSPSLAQWFRGGSSPEVGQVTLELSTDGGGSWMPFGSGNRTVGGWNLIPMSGQSLPAAGMFRARGRTFDHTGNPGLVEQTLVVLSALEKWRGQTFGVNAGTPAIAGNAADPDGDGAANLFEYVTASDPLDGRSGPRFTWGRENGQPVLTYERRVGLTGVLVGIERSNDLATWTDAAFTEQVISNNGATVTVKATVTENLGQPRVFLRAKLTPLP